MISDVLSDALAEIEKYQRDMLDAYAVVAVEIGVVKTIMDGLRITLDAAPGQGEQFEKLVEELQESIRDVDVSRLAAAREHLLAFVKEAVGRLPQEPEQDDGVLTGPSDHGWLPLGAVTIDTARLLLVDPIHQGRVDAWAEDGQIAIPGGNYSAVQVPTGIGDGRYQVEGRVTVSPHFGPRLAEIRVRFLDEDGNWLGSDPQQPAHAEPRGGTI